MINRAVIAALASVMLLPANMAATEVPTEEWCKTFYSLTRTYYLGDDYSEEAVVDAYDAVTDQDVVACRSALNMLEADGINAASGLAEVIEEMADDAIVHTTDTASSAAGAVAMKGKGTRKTKPFELAGGNYEVTFKKKGDCSGELTYASLERADGGYGGGQVDQDDYFYGIEDGLHYWEVDAWSGKCQWTLTLRPL